MIKVVRKTSKPDCNGEELLSYPMGTAFEVMGTGSLVVMDKKDEDIAAFSGGSWISVSQER